MLCELSRSSRWSSLCKCDECVLACTIDIAMTTASTSHNVSFKSPIFTKRNSASANDNTNSAPVYWCSMKKLFCKS